MRVELIEAALSGPPAVTASSVGGKRLHSGIREGFSPRPLPGSGNPPAASPDGPLLSFSNLPSAPRLRSRRAGDSVADLFPVMTNPIRHVHFLGICGTAMGAAGRRRMEEEFTWEHFRARLLEAYRVARRVAR